MRVGACMFGLEHGNLACCKRRYCHDEVIQRQKPAPNWQAENRHNAHTLAHTHIALPVVSVMLPSTFGVSGEPLISFPMAQRKPVASLRFWIELSLYHDLTC